MPRVHCSAHGQLEFKFGFISSGSTRGGLQGGGEYHLLLSETNMFVRLRLMCSAHL